MRFLKLFVAMSTALLVLSLGLAAPAGRAGPRAQTASRRFDVASSSITTTDARRRTVGFTNGYDFGYFSLVVPSGSPITGFDKLAAGQRIGVVQGTVQEAYLIDTLH